MDNASGDYLTSLAIDKEGNPHIAYYDKFDGNLKYATKNGTNWNVENVKSSGNFASLKLDSVGNPHIAYYNQNSGYLEYAFKNNGTWNYTNITSYRGNAGWFPSLVLDSNNNPSISFYNNGVAHGKIEYAFKSGDDWIIECIDSNFTSAYSSLALDADNNPYISYFDKNNSILMFARRVNGTWNLEIVENNSNPDKYIVQFLDGPSLALDAEGNPTIAYSDRTTGFLKFAKRVNGNWTIENVDVSINPALYISLALNSNGNPSISYCDFNSSNGTIYRGFLKYATKSNGTWTTKILDNNLIDGLSTSLAFYNGNPGISYCYYNLNFTEGKLKYIQFIPDINPPIVISIDPGNKSVINIVNKTITVTFSENIMNGTSFDNISVIGPYGVVLLSKSILGNILLLNPAADYVNGIYHVHIAANAINDLAGNVLETEYDSIFTIDTVAPNASADIKGGLYNTTQLVNLTISEPGSIYYTLDGSIPSNTSTKYASHIYINYTSTLKFIAFDLAGNPSLIGSESYVIDRIVPMVVADIKGGSYNSNQLVTLSMSEQGIIYYTTNGSTPTISSMKYSGPIVISSTIYLKFLAVDLAGNPSPICFENYRIDKIAPSVISTYPKHYATGVSRTAVIYIKFTENIKASVNWSKIVVKDKYGKSVKISKWISGNRLYIKTNSKRSANSYYTVYISAYALKDVLGNNMAKNYLFRFKTGK